MRNRCRPALTFAVLALATPAAYAAVNPEGAARRVIDDTEHVTQTLKLDPGGTLRVKNFSGRVTITAGDRPEVVIDAIRRAPRERLNRIKLDIHADGSTIFVDANSYDRRDWWFDHFHSNVVETDFDIKVPTRTNLDVHVFSSPVEVTGVAGSHDVHAFSGRLRLDDVSGPIRAHTFSGPVEIRTKTWQPNQKIDVHTFSGSIEVHIPESARGSVTFDSFSGRLTSDMPLTLRGTNRRAIRASLGGREAEGQDPSDQGSNTGSLRLKTFSGNARIDR